MDREDKIGKAGPGGGEMRLTDAEVRVPMNKPPGTEEEPLANVEVRTRVASGENERRGAVPRTIKENLDRLLEVLEADGAASLDFKDESGELADAVRRIARGKSELNPELAAQLLKVLRWIEAQGEESAKPSSKLLTPRELEVLRLLARGQTNRDIANNLVLSPGTVRVHVQHIISKLGVSDRTEAAVHASELGLL